MLETYEQRPRAKLATTIISVLVVAGLVLVIDHWRTREAARLTAATAPASTSTIMQPATTASPPGTTITPTITSNYKDGSYTATSNYFVPHGSEAIKVNATLQSGVVASISVSNSENDFDSASYQESFSTAYKSHVLGKKINGLQLDVIAGASDTTQAFNEALSRIASKAQT